MACLDQAGTPPITGFNARMGHARVLAKQQQYAAATECLGEAIHAVEVAGADCTGAALRQIEFYERFNEAHDLLVQCELAEGHVEQMLFCAEKLRNRVLQDELLRSESGIDPLRFLPSAQRRQFMELQRRLGDLYAEQRKFGAAASCSNDDRSKINS